MHIATKAALIAGSTTGVVFAHEAFTRHFEPAKRRRALDLTVDMVTSVGIGVGAVAAGIAAAKAGPRAAIPALVGGAAMVAGAQVARLATYQVVHGEATTPLIPPFFELGKRTNFVGSRAFENVLAGAPLGAVLLAPHLGWAKGAGIGAGVSVALALAAFHDDFDKKTIDV